MPAIDTNVLVRLLTGDDPAQLKRVTALFKREAIFIPKTVFLECEWVLRRLYGLEKQVVVSAFRRVSGLPNVEIEQPLAITQALLWCEAGMDFADALHLASSQGSDGFATFDEKLRKSAPSDLRRLIKLL